MEAGHRCVGKGGVVSAANKPHPWELARLAQFAGKVVLAVEFVDCGEFHIPSLTFTDGTFAMAWCDPEGNGPGHLALYNKNGVEIIPETGGAS